MELTLIQNKILSIRGQKILLDRDLAELYGVETKRLNEAVRRNIERFRGEDFMFQLSKEEILEVSRSQFATLNKTENLEPQIVILKKEEAVIQNTDLTLLPNLVWRC
jgi:hypothetical protein